LFPDKRQAPWGAKWVEGLLLEGVGKTAAELARAVPDGDVQAMQQFVTDSPWPDQPIIAELHSVVQEHYGEADGILVTDDTGFPKKGNMSVGVARQYTGTVGKVENCQIGVFLAYVTGQCRVLIDRRLYLPASWVSDKARREKAGVPKQVKLRTKPQLALEMIQQALQGGLSARWVTCDDAYGRDCAYRDGIEALGLQYVCEVPCNTTVHLEAPTAHSEGRRSASKPRTTSSKAKQVQNLEDQVKQWRYIEVREGTKKPIASHWAALRVRPHRRKTPGPICPIPVEPVHLLIERRDDGKHKYYLSNAPEDTPLQTMVRVAKEEWFVEPCFRDVKQEVGLDKYELRKWRGWHHFMTLCLLAYLFLTLTKTRLAKKNSD
jgi:SRSO17 transposase